MTMQRWDITASDGMQRMVGGRFVLAADAEAAVTSALADDRAILMRAENAWREEIRLRLHEQYEQGQRDMLAKCIAALIDERDSRRAVGGVPGPAWTSAVAVLRSLQEKP